MSSQAFAAPASAGQGTSSGAGSGNPNKRTLRLLNSSSPVFRTENSVGGLSAIAFGDLLSGPEMERSKTAIWQAEPSKTGIVAGCYDLDGHPISKRKEGLLEALRKGLPKLSGLDHSKSLIFNCDLNVETG